MCSAKRSRCIPATRELLYWGALAHARAGAAKTAHALLDRAQAAASPAPGRLSDILSLRGRLWKDGFHRAQDGAVATELGRARAARVPGGLPAAAGSVSGHQRGDAVAAAGRPRDGDEPGAGNRGQARRADDTTHVLGSRHGGRGGAAAPGIRPRAPMLRGRLRRGPGRRRQRGVDAAAGGAASRACCPRRPTC